MRREGTEWILEFDVEDLEHAARIRASARRLGLEVAGDGRTFAVRVADAAAAYMLGLHTAADGGVQSVEIDPAADVARTLRLVKRDG